MKTLTKTLSVGLLGLCLLASACGNDTPGPGQDPNTPPPNKCGSCASFEACNSATNTCSINPNSTWFLAVESAKIASTKTTGEAWDSLGGAPDPFVMLDLRKTTTKQDTFSPTWGEGASYTAASLTGTGVSLTVYDEDLAANDLIGGPSTVRLTDADFRRGLITITKLGQVDSLVLSVAPR